MAEQDGQIQFKPLTQAGKGATACRVTAHERLVILHFPQPVEWVGLDPQTAVMVAEQMARAAFQLRHGYEPRDNADVLQSEIKKKAVEEVRQRMINRIVLMLRTFQENRPPVELQAREVVDRILQEAT